MYTHVVRAGVRGVTHWGDTAPMEGGDADKGGRSYEVTSEFGQGWRTLNDKVWPFAA